MNNLIFDYSNTKSIKEKYLPIQKRIEKRISTPSPIIQKNSEWVEKREAGKLQRKIETDSIQSFIKYAEAQGSKNASKYYIIMSRMTRAHLVDVEILKEKHKNLREHLDTFSLNALQMADHIVATTIVEGMRKNMPYKEIYQDAKSKVESFASLIGRKPHGVTLKDKSES